MIKVKEDKLLEAIDIITDFENESVFDDDEKNYYVGDYKISKDGWVIHIDKDEIPDEVREKLKSEDLIIDKKETIKLLEAETGTKAVYQGVPSCAYKIGEYIVDRKGNVKVDKTRVEVSIPSGHYTAESLKNLIYMISAKGELLSKAVGVEGAFKVDRELIEDLACDLSPTLEKICTTLKRSTGELKGLTIDENKITFTGFPSDESTPFYIQLAELMNRASKMQKRVSAKANEVENEKYSFRVWLMSIGMKGDEYKEARKALLSKLDGNTAFRTEEQAKKHKEKMNELSKQGNN